tara:strand:+ start:63 stop:323 length:261 start_codon:yes stop_codon:yes gene_type:complete
MVYNITTKDFRMGEYDVALKKMHQYDSIKKEVDGYMSLLNKLIIPENDIPSDYVTHSVTGAVYDLRIIRQNVDRLNKELEDLEEYA